jgi:HlyD family secretion protein
VPQVKIGQTADLTVDAYPGRKFKGMVTEVGSSPIPKTDPDLLTLVANSEAINFKVKIRVQEPPNTVRPGFSVTAEIVTGKNDGATAIPIQALVVRDVPKKDKKGPAASGRPETEEGVYAVKNGKLEFQKVETGLAGELMIEVKKGPSVGQEIVTGPFKVLRQVKEGDKVIVDKEGDKKKGTPGPAAS